MDRDRLIGLLVGSVAALLAGPVAGASAGALPPAGTILVADLEANAVFAIDPATGAQSVVASGGPFENPEGLVVEPGTCDAIVSDAAAAKVFRVSLADGTITTIASGPPMVHPVGGVLDERGHLLSSDEEAFAGNPGGVIDVDLQTGQQTVVASAGNFVTPLGVALAPDGTTYVADADAFADARGGVIRVDRSSGAQTVVSVDPGAGQHPQGILWWQGQMLLTDMARGGLFRVDPTTGAQTPVVVGSGLVTPREIEGDDADHVLVADYSARAVFRVTLSTGAVQTVSSGGLLVGAFGIATVPAGCVPRPAPPTPAPNPTSPPTPTPTPPVADRTAPVVQLLRVPTSARRTSLLRGLSVRLSVDGPARVRVELRRPEQAGQLGRQLATAKVARRTAAGAFTVRIAARPADLRKLLRTSRRVVVRIVATDAAGNARARTRTVRVHPG